MKKKQDRNSVPFEEVLERFKEDKEFLVLYEERLFYFKVAHLVRDLRIKAGLSQQEVAKKAKVSQPMIARLEKGDVYRVPTFATMHKILIALGYTISLEIKPYKSA